VINFHNNSAQHPGLDAQLMYWLIHHWGSIDEPALPTLNEAGTVD